MAMRGNCGLGRLLFNVSARLWTRLCYGDTGTLLRLARVMLRRFIKRSGLAQVVDRKFSDACSGRKLGC